MQAPSRKPNRNRKPNRKRSPRSKYSERKDRHTTSMLANHIVLTPKFRDKVLKGGVAIECEKQIRWVCKQLDVDILEMAVADDHVHLFLRTPPKLAPSKIVEKIKSNTSRELRKRFPHLVRWNSKALWAPGCFHGSVGQGFDVVEKYVASQKAYRG